MTPKEVSILVGYRVGDGEPVYMHPRHTMITGMTGDAGKTTCIEGIASRWQGQKFVVFLAKPGEQAFQSQRRIKPFFKQKSGWQYVEALIEASQQEKIKIIRTTLIKICDRTKTLEEVFGNANHRIAEYDQKGKGGFEYDMLIQVREYLRHVLNELKEHELADTLDLQEGINVVDLTDFSAVMQAMVIGAIAEEILRNHEHTSIVIPEAWQTIPGDRGSPATASVEALIRQGRVRGNFVLIDSQDIAGVNTKIRRHIGNYLLGKQQDEHEIERTLKAIPLSPKSKPRAEEVQTLKKGQFFAVIDEKVEKIYARPSWMPEENAIQIALHPEDVNLFAGFGTTKNVISLEEFNDKDSEHSKGVTASTALLLHQNSNSNIMQEYERLKAENEELKKDIKYKDAKIESLIEMGTTEKQRADSLLKERDSLEFYRKQLAEFLWPIYKDYLGAIPKKLSTGAQEGAEEGLQDIIIEEKRVNITVERIREPVKFAEDSIEGRLVKMMKAGELDGWRTVPNIAKSIVNAGGEDDEGKVRAAVEMFARSPYHLLEQRKNPSSRAWEFRLDKAEAEQAFKQ